MRSIRFGLGLLVFLTLAVPARGAVGPTLQSLAARPSGYVDVIIVLQNDLDVSRTASAGRPSGFADTRSIIESRSRSSSANFLDLAAAHNIELLDLRTYWIAPVIKARVQAHQIQAIDKLAGVSSVIEDAAIELLNPVRFVGATSAIDATAAGFDAVGARTMWQLGLTGKGSLVASLDTGVDGLHPALAARYRGRTSEPGASWLDPEGGTFPNDPLGHGTHTMGTVLGREAADTVGIAPDAEWIAAGVVDRGRTFSQTLSDLVAAFQWLADPDGDPDTHTDRPDVVLNSWGIPQGILPQCDATFWEVVDNLEALGTVVIFAAGNEGPGPSTLRMPADRDQYLKCFAVGAVDANDPLAGAAPFSSRGPSLCNSTNIKPEIVAPGINVRSCKVGGGYHSMSGTSMAAPYVVGAVALMREYNPDATPQEIKQALVASALDVGAAGPDFSSGYGLLDIPGAIAMLPPPQPVRWRLNVPLAPTPDDPLVELALPTINLIIENLGRSLEQVSVQISSRHGSASIQGVADFYYEQVDAGSGVIEVPVTLVTHSEWVSGDRIWLDLTIRSQAPALDSTMMVGIQVGLPPRAVALAQSSGQLTITTSNVGRFDAQEAEAIDVHLSTFEYAGTSLPFSGGLRVITSGQDASGLAGTGPFEPSPEGQMVQAADGSLSFTRFRDTRRTDPAGVEFSQRVFSGEEGPGAYLLVDYAWQRMWTPDEAIRLGAWFNWQPDPNEERMQAATDEICLKSGGMYYGAMWLSDKPVEYLAAEYETGMTAFPSEGIPISLSSSASFLSTLTQQQTSTPSGRFAVVLVAAGSLEEWREAAQRARAHYARLSGADQEVLPEAFELLANYPNPFNPATNVRYTLNQQSQVRLDVFNVLGRRVYTLVNETQAPGTYQVFWQATDEQGLPLPSGVYFIRLAADDQVRTGKMSLIR
jgi:subtilisin family serine protease